VADTNTIDIERDHHIAKIVIWRPRPIFNTLNKMCIVSSKVTQQVKVTVTI